AENHTDARIGSNASALDVTGAVDVSAKHHGGSETKADAKSSGGTAIGAAIALSFVDDSATATTHKNITADGAVSFTASADGASKAHAIAGAAGTDKAQEDSGKGNKSADDQQAKTTALANSKSGGSGGKAKTSGQSANTDAGGDSSSSVGVAAALALNVASSSADASIDG